MIKKIIDENKDMNVLSKKVEILKSIFPNAVKNDVVDLKILEKELNPQSIIKEGYELSFLGKSYAKLISALNAETVIVPDIEHNSKEENENSENIYISGDNLEALKHLVKSYYNSIRCIYIDPPYNTGSDGFIYNDSFQFTIDELLLKVGISDSEAKRVLEMISTKNSSHSAWLTFMYPRLYLARQLLLEDGFIFISIDENELFNLKLLMDQIFGENNFISCLAVENNPKGRKNSKFISISNDFCLIYSKNKDNENAFFLSNIPKNINDLDEDEHGNFIHNSGKRVLVGENRFNKFVTNFDSPKHYSVYKKDDIIHIIKETSIKSEMNNLIECGFERFYSYRDDNFVENTYTEEQFRDLFVSDKLEFKNGKIYEKNMNTAIRIKSMLTNKEYIGVVNGIQSNVKLDYKTTSAGTYLKNLFEGKKVFTNPKPIGLLYSIITLLEDSDAIIMDFFSGSGTTADAVNQINQMDNGNRRFIVIQLPENLDEMLLNSTAEGKEVAQNAINICDSIGKPHTLDWIGMERIRRASKYINDTLIVNNKIGFKHYTILPITSNQLTKLETFNPDTLLSDNGILDEFGIETVLTTWINYDGFGLTKSATKLDLQGYTAYQIENTVYFLTSPINDQSIKCFIEKYEDYTFVVNKIVIFGCSFTMNEVQTLKDNLKQIRNIKKISLDIEVRY